MDFKCSYQILIMYIQLNVAQLAGAVEYIDSFSTEG